MTFEDLNPADGHISYHPLLSTNAARAGTRRRPALQITRLVETTATIDSKVCESFGDRQNSPKLRKESAFAESASSRYDGILSRILKGHAFGSLATKEECLGV
jgi:hypothetical protein